MWCMEAIALTIWEYLKQHLVEMKHTDAITYLKFLSRPVIVSLRTLSTNYLFISPKVTSYIAYFCTKHTHRWRKELFSPVPTMQ